VASDRGTRLVDRAELAEILVSLLQVVAEDGLELLATIAFCIDLVGPFDELGVHGRAARRADRCRRRRKVMVEAMRGRIVEAGCMKCLRARARIWSPSFSRICCGASDSTAERAIPLQ
jgi:hypothetical protein